MRIINSLGPDQRAVFVNRDFTSDPLLAAHAVGPGETYLDGRPYTEGKSFAPEFIIEGPTKQDILEKLEVLIQNTDAFARKKDVTVDDLCVTYRGRPGGLFWSVRQKENGRYLGIYSIAALDRETSDAITIIYSPGRENSILGKDMGHAIITDWEKAT